MRLLYTSPVFLEHDTGRHPECRERLTSVIDRLSDSEVWKSLEQPSWEAATELDLARLHSPEYVAAVREIAERGGGQIEADTFVSRRSYEVARMAAGSAIDAVRQVMLRGSNARAVCLLRPPGHHALPAGGMGFCLFNHVALAARYAVKTLGLSRILIVDWDVHHGNGTQDAFYADPQVAFLSIHRSPFYPGTGAADETGIGPGIGTTLNVPLPFRTSRQEYQESFRAALERIADRIRPELVLLSAGFDAHRLDPIGSLGLETEDYDWLTQDVIEVAQTHAHGRLVSVLEGGYNVAVLPDCLQQYLLAMAAP